MTALIILAFIFSWLFAGYLGGWLTKFFNSGIAHYTWDANDECGNRVLIMAGPIYLFLGILFILLTFLDEWTSKKQKQYFRSWWP